MCFLPVEATPTIDRDAPVAGEKFFQHQSPGGVPIA